MLTNGFSISHLVRSTLYCTGRIQRDNKHTNCKKNFVKKRINLSLHFFFSAEMDKNCSTSFSSLLSTAVFCVRFLLLFSFFCSHFRLLRILSRKTQRSRSDLAAVSPLIARSLTKGSRSEGERERKRSHISFFSLSLSLPSLFLSEISPSHEVRTTHKSREGEGGESKYALFRVFSAQIASSISQAQVYSTVSKRARTDMGK